MNFQFQNPVILHAGRGMRHRLGNIASRYGTKALVVTTGSVHSRKLAEEAGKSLESAGLGWVQYAGVRPNPLGSMAEEGAQVAKDNGCDLIIGIGGGSVMDASKGIAFSCCNPGPLFDYVYGRRQGSAALPILLLATTAGTGSEGNWTAVFTDTDHVKKGIGNPLLFPKESIIDPELMLTLPPRGIAGPGFDALSHAIESFLSLRANPMSLLYSRQAIQWLMADLPKVYADPADLEAWDRVTLASTFAGIAIGSAGCAAPHGMEHPVSGLLDVPHGEGLAALYPAFLRFLRPHVPAAFAELAVLTGADTTGLNEEEASFAAIESIESLRRRLSLDRGLSTLGVEEEHLDWLAKTAVQTMPAVFGNTPVVMDEATVRQLLHCSL